MTKQTNSSAVLHGVGDRYLTYNSQLVNGLHSGHLPALDIHWGSIACLAHRFHAGCNQLGLRHE